MARPAAVALLLLWLSALPASAYECWTGWGYWVEPGSLAFKSERLSLATKGAAAWRLGAPVELFLRDGERGAILADQPPLRVLPATPRFTIENGLQKVDDVAPVEGRSELLMFGLSRIAPLYQGTSVGPEWLIWACGLSDLQE